MLRVAARSTGACLLAVAMLAEVGVADGPSAHRVSERGGSRLDSLHQLAAAGDTLVLAHARVGEGGASDRVIVQRSTDGGASWSRERALFTSGSRHRQVLPNLAVGARGRVVSVAFRAQGPRGTTLFVRTSRDGGRRFGPRVAVATRSGRSSVGVPAVAVGDGVVAVAWTDRRDGTVEVRRSRDDGRTFGKVAALGRTRLTIECRARVTDGLVGLAASGPRLYVAWAEARDRSCLADRIVVRASVDRGSRWRSRRTLTASRSYGWPELVATGRSVLATVQLTSGHLLVARSRDEGARWRQVRLAPRRGRVLSAGDVLVRRGDQVWVAFVEERIRGDRLRTTRVRAVRSRDGGASFGRAVTLAPTARSLRQAVNVADTERGRVAVFQSGDLSGQPRNLLVARWR